MDRSADVRRHESGGAWSHLVRGAWIEVIRTKAVQLGIGVAPRERCVDRSFPAGSGGGSTAMSHLVRGAWIEVAHNALEDAYAACRTS